MEEYRLIVIDAAEEPDETDLEIFSALREYNQAQAGPSGHQALTVFLRDAAGAVVGGLKGSTSWDWLHVSLLVVAAEVRNQGWGSKLLAAAEREAVRRGCHHSYLETFSFQARPFYEKHGYTVFGTLEGYPPGHRCYWLRKTLAWEDTNTAIGDETAVAAVDDFDRLIREAEAQPFSGWDFSFLTGRWEESEPSWNYRQLVTERLPQATFLLDMGTGGGEFLASLSPLPAYTCATEGYAPNVAVARERLAPLGISVVALENDAMLPFPDDTFDLVINRHESFSAGEVWRILRPGGLFLTQQVGGQDNIRLNRWLQDEVAFEYADWTLQAAVQQLKDAGFTIQRTMEEFPETHFFDIGAIVYYLKVTSWQIPDFSVVTHRERLRNLADAILIDGYFTVNSHRFFIEAQKPA